jgi:hypothetical protein
VSLDARVLVRGACVDIRPVADHATRKNSRDCNSCAVRNLGCCNKSYFVSSGNLIQWLELSLRQGLMVVTRGYPTELIMDILGKILGFVLERAIGYLVDFISVDYTGWLLTMLQITMARTCSTHNVTIIG